MLKFSANVSTLFPDIPFLKRFEEAKNYGFTHVEIQSVYDFPCSDIMKNLSGMKCDLINSYCGEESGYASIPGREYDFCNSMSKLLEYRSLEFKKVHIMAGKRCPDITEEEQFNTFVSMLDSATDIMENYNWIGLIEPICPEVKKDYFLSSFDMAVKVIEATTNSNIKLLLDVYHLHMLTGDVKSNLEKFYPYAGHVQISQHPGRREPFHPDGLIDFNFVFNFLKNHHHQDFIGLEYFPSESSKKSFDWMKEYI